MAKLNRLVFDARLGFRGHFNSCTNYDALHGTFAYLWSFNIMDLAFGFAVLPLMGCRREEYVVKNTSSLTNCDRSDGDIQQN